MNYIKVIWNQDDEDFPVALYSELDARRMEIRKVEVFRCGFLGFASKEEKSPTTFLGTIEVPELETLAADPSFEPSVIPAHEFETMWQKAIRGFTINSAE